MGGNKPTSGKITISNGEVLQIGTTMTVGDYDVIYSNNKFTAANPSDYTGNALIFKKLRDAKIEGISCDDSSCTDGSVYLFAAMDGKVGVNFYDGYCYVNADGSSYCVNA